jgi:integrase
LSLREKNGKWEYRFRLQGQPVSKVTDLAAIAENRTRALKLEQKHRDAILRGEKPVRRQTARGFSDASQEFMEWCEVQHLEKPNTVKRVSTSLWSLREWFGSKNVSAIRRSDIERYKTWRLRTHQVQPITLRHDLDALSKFFKWSIVMDLRMDNPVRDVAKPSTENAIRMHIVTEAEEFLYFERCAECGYQNLADVGRLILDQGMRPDEVYSLECRGVDLDLGRIRIFQGKSAAARRFLTLTTESRMIIERRYRDADGSKWLFPSPKLYGAHLTKLNNAHNEVCGDDLRFVLYDLRHTFATRAAEGGMDLGTLAAILGHSSLRMVLRYVHIRQQHMDAEMKKLDAQAKFRPRTELNQAKVQ